MISVFIRDGEVMHADLSRGEGCHLQLLVAVGRGLTGVRREQKMTTRTGPATHYSLQLEECGSRSDWSLRGSQRCSPTSGTLRV